MTENEQMDDLLIEFDEMGFIPTTTVPDPQRYAMRWRDRMCQALKGYRKAERGEWRTVTDYKISVITECSACKKQFYFMKKGQLNIDRMPFCPNCGADVRGNDNV